MKLWGSRVSTTTDDLVHRLNASFHFDRLMYAEDIAGSTAWARALQTAGVLTDDEFQDIERGLKQVLSEFDQDEFQAVESDEDIHTAVERRLTEIIGPIGGKLHTGRSRNDQVATDFRLWVMRGCDHIQIAINELQTAIIEQAEKNIEVPLPGYTHLQPAQPIIWGHWMLAHFWGLDRDQDRFRRARLSADVLPLGSGALAGTPFQVNRQQLANDLGFSEISQNSIDAISDRDFAVEFLFAATLLGLHLSRISEQLILYSSAEFGFVELHDSVVTGSSLMPQKKNPDPLELARGKSGRLIGNLTGLLATLKGLPSVYDKDLQEDKEPVFDAFETVIFLLSALSVVIRTLRIHPDRMHAQINPAMMATDLADYLVARGLPFREAHHAAGAAVAMAESKGISLDKLELSDLQSINPGFQADVEKVFDLKFSLARRSVPGGTAPEAVHHQLMAAREKIASGFADSI
jgi:argininosuccinate lyase